jgi:polysaccharide deacetylase 2 family uncharacterized protein YibQ
MAKRNSESGAKHKLTPAARLGDMRPVFGRLRIAPPTVSRRQMIGGGIGIFAGGIGLGVLLGRLTHPPTPEPARVAEAPASRLAEAQPPVQFMEEEPLPQDVYIPPSEPLVAEAPPIPTEKPPVPAAPAPAPPPVALNEPSVFHHAPAPVAIPEAPPEPAPIPHPVPPPRSAQTSPAQTSPSIVASASGGPTWLRNARPFVEASGQPVMAIVIDDLGLDQNRTRQAIGLDGNVTLAFMTYAEKLPQWREAAHDAKHELLVHVPMQPLSPTIDPGPNALTTSLSDAAITQRLRWGLDRLDGYVGANNHMGSRFTEDAAGMRIVMEELKSRGLLFLDSRTTPRSACPDVAAANGLPFVSRNVFLDDETTVDGVRRQLQILEGVARKHGSAIGIGHPHDATLAVLAQYLPGAASRGIAVLPLTSVMRHAVARS